MAFFGIQRSSMTMCSTPPPLASHFCRAHKKSETANLYLRYYLKQLRSARAGNAAPSDNLYTHYNVSAV
jgi:hypothetical protein